MNNEEISKAYYELLGKDNENLWYFVRKSCSDYQFPIKDIDNSYDTILHSYLVEDAVYKLNKDFLSLIDYIRNLNDTLLEGQKRLLQIYNSKDLESYNNALWECESILSRATDRYQSHSFSLIHYNYHDPQAPEYLLKICIKAIREHKDSIKQIIHNHPTISNFTLEVVQLIVPVIAQSYAGIPALAVVGSIILLCKQGLNKIIDS